MSAEIVELLGDSAPFEPEIGDKMLIFIRMVLGLIFITVFDCTFTEDKKTKKRTFLSRKICSVSAVFAVAAVCVCVMFFCGMLPVLSMAIRPNGKYGTAD